MCLSLNYILSSRKKFKIRLQLLLPGNNAYRDHSNIPMLHYTNSVDRQNKTIFFFLNTCLLNQYARNLNCEILHCKIKCFMSITPVTPCCIEYKFIIYERKIRAACIEYYRNVCIQERCTMLTIGIISAIEIVAISYII